MEIFGYFASVIIGVLLGLIGGGGSILTMPVLVYLFGIMPVTATAYSLFIVGISSLIGSINYVKHGLVSLKTAIVFGIPSIITVFLTRKFIVPAIPAIVFSNPQFIISKDVFLLLLFGILMLIVSVSMLKKAKDSSNNHFDNPQFNYLIILLEGTFVGVLTGLVGAGGGFLIIPALVMLSKLPFKQAIGTSLLIIAAKSLIGFVGELHSFASFDWSLLIVITVLAILGIFMGIYLSKFVNSEKLKPGFGIFTLIIGIAMIIKELYF